jgi:hypothetical protein
VKAFSLVSHVVLASLAVAVAAFPTPTSAAAAFVGILPTELGTLVTDAAQYLSRYPGLIKERAEIEPQKCDDKKIGSTGGRDQLWYHCSMSAYGLAIAATGVSFPPFTDKVLVIPWRVERGTQFMAAMLAVMRVYDPPMVPDEPMPDVRSLTKALDTIKLLFDAANAKKIVKRTFTGINASYTLAPSEKEWAVLLESRKGP